jgi:hypothetical protein
MDELDMVALIVTGIMAFDSFCDNLSDYLINTLNSRNPCVVKFILIIQVFYNVFIAIIGAVFWEGSSIIWEGKKGELNRLMNLTYP